jgi:Ca2+-binding EF-hand superfamily protein
MKNRVMKTTYALAFALALSASGAAFAQSAPADGMPHSFLVEIDTDKDGRISLIEYTVFMENAFKKLDKDGNGSLSPAETVDVLTVEQFAVMDKNKDGSVSQTEFMDHVLEDFRRQDKNGDGFL